MELTEIDNIYPPSEGELFIAMFLDDINVDYEREYKITLNNDFKSHRRVDFYLTQFDIGIEFFGAWNKSKEDRERYKDKMKVYQNNNFPCIYIFPENLGNLKYVFNLRIRQLMYDFGEIKLIRKLNFIQALGDLGYYTLLAYIAFMIGLFTINKIFTWLLAALVFALACILFLALIVGFRYFNITSEYKNYLKRRNVRSKN